MARRHRRTAFATLFDRLRGFTPDEDAKLHVEADAIEATHGEDAIAFIRERIVSADRTARRQLYRIHDELARRRRDYAGDPVTI
jgi:hypothetical protein